MRKFDINRYPGRYAMACRTKSEAEEFCNYLHKIGRTWANGESYENNSKFEIYKADTVYLFNDGYVCGVRFDECEKYSILDWRIFTAISPNLKIYNLFKDTSCKIESLLSKKYIENLNFTEKDMTMLRELIEELEVVKSKILDSIK